LNFKINTDVWFIFCLIFLGILSLFIFLYIIIPYRTRKRNKNRRQKRITKKLDNFERLEKKYAEEKIRDLEINNNKLKVTLKNELETMFKNNEVPNLESFFSEFEKLYQDFIASLFMISPNLTANEIKLAAFLRLNLSSKEISKLLNITPESVNKARYRLRKKLQLSAKDDLSTFIINT
jgi:DNA-binding CsgD family transcriptional regulator